MKYILFLSVFIFHKGGLYAQDSLQKPDIMLHADEKPMFPGGDGELRKYLALNLRYPNEALENEVEGSVEVIFKINKSGKISDIKMKKSMGYGCDEEAMRVVKRMPDWIPARKNNRTIPVIYTLPIVFELPQSVDESKSE